MSARRGSIKHIFASEAELRNVLLHIEQDRAEKEEEIQVKCDEEFEVEKYREIVTKVHFIELNYKAKEERVRRSVVVDNVCMKNKTRMERLQERHMHVLSIVEEVRENIDSSPGNEKYKQLLSNLLLEGLFKMLEEDIKVWCRPEDIGLLQAILPPIKKKFNNESGLKAKVVIDEDNSIGPETGGGIVLVNENNTVSVCNTIESRIDRIVTSIQPLMVYTLFKAQEGGETRIPMVFEMASRKMFPTTSLDEITFDESTDQPLSVKTDKDFT